MKRWFLPLLLAATSVLSAITSSAQELKKPAYLDPEDLGIVKYVFEAEAPEGSVIVFCKEEYRDDRRMLWHETITHQSDGKHSEAVMLIDWATLRGTYNFTLKTSTGIRNVDSGSLTFRGWRGTPPTLTLVITDSEAKTPYATTFVFTMRVEPYDEVKKRVPSLAEPKKDTGWTYSKIYERNGKRVD